MPSNGHLSSVLRRIVASSIAGGAAVGRTRLSSAEGSSENALGSYFARLAHLEAATGHAFEVLLRELELFRAPHDLIARAKIARADEIRHAWAFGRLAAEHGTTPLPLEVAPMSDRALLDITLENAAEGVVRETWRALCVEWQAENVEDEALRELLSSIAEDEAEHAELAHAVDEWLRTRLDEDERALVELEKRRALSLLRSELAAAEPVSCLVERAGVPDRQRSLDLFRRLEAELFASETPFDALIFADVFARTSSYAVGGSRSPV